MKKILHVLQSNTFSGAENVVVYIINSLENEYNFVYSSANGQIRDVLEENKIQYKLMNNLTYRELKTVIEKVKPDIIHSHDVRAALLCSILKGKRKLIAHIHVNNNNMKKINIKTIGLLLASVKIDYFFWVSKSCYDGFVFKKFISKKSEILENILSKKSIEEKCSKDNNDYSYDVVYVGRLTYQKNPERLIKICQHILEKNSSLKIGIVGTGDLEDVVKSKINLMNSNNIKYLGFQSNPLKIIKDAKVMIMTSRFEGTPMVALESLALGTPIVSTPVDGMKHLIKNDFNGYLCFDDEELTKSILDIIDDNQLYQQMSQNCKKRFDDLCDENKYLNRIRKEYDNG
ncbi:MULTISPECIES: glycosyltransferase [Coprobacillaceae]|uniref:glycosyltransferase n=1 Tax=Coprobacillaceae TaxID=2810280 RepID=UPI0013147973|nr:MULTISPECIES: glycosyltransferase [Coprobacillaceae]